MHTGDSQQGAEMAPPQLSMSIFPQQKSAATTVQVESPAKAGNDSTLFSSCSTSSSFAEAIVNRPTTMIELQPPPIGKFDKKQVLAALKNTREPIPWNQKKLEQLTARDLNDNFPLVYTQGVSKQNSRPD